MNNKKAWFRIAEAVIAILIVISGVLIVVSKKNPEISLSGSISERQMKIFEIIRNNESLRNHVISRENNKIIDSIFPFVPKSWNYTIETCDLNKMCNSKIVPKDKDVYVSEMIVSSNITVYNNTKLRFFVWVKN